jgi:hypothetical protein
MDTRHLVLLIFSGLGSSALFYFRAEIVEAIRRGPWGGDPPPPVGPLGAADPFRRKLKKNSYSE